jgi:Domain of unknown function (DUF4062)
MPTQVTVYRVFIASPGGLEPERETFRRVLNDYNESDALEAGALFIPVGWELARAGMGRPQELINNDLRRCDYCVLVLRDRWGSPAGGGSNYSSGTEEEYHVARGCLGSGTMRNVVVLFGAVDPSKLSDPGEQLTKVIEFRRQLEAKRELLFSTYDELPAFEKQLRGQLAGWLREHRNGLVA